MIRSLNLLPIVFGLLAGSECFGQALQSSSPVPTSAEATIPAGNPVEVDTTVTVIFRFGG